MAELPPLPKIEEFPIPPARLQDLITSLVTRQDALLEMMLRVQKRQAELLEMMLGVRLPPPVVVPPPAAPPAVIPEALVLHRDYIIDEGAVTAPDKYADIDVLGLLGRTGTRGYVISDDGTLKVKFNDGHPATLKKGEALSLVDLGLEIEKIEIRTDEVTPQAYRVFVR